MAEDIEYSGPVFDGRAEAAARRLVRDMDQTLADKGKEMVVERLGQVIRHPTGYYESRVRVTVQSSVDRVIEDGGVVYGPWLEGTGSRNRTTRFKGYRTFRLIGQELDSRADEIVRPDVERAVREMN